MSRSANATHLAHIHVNKKKKPPSRYRHCCEIIATFASAPSRQTRVVHPRQRSSSAGTSGTCPLRLVDMTLMPCRCDPVGDADLAFVRRTETGKACEGGEMREGGRA